MKISLGNKDCRYREIFSDTDYIRIGQLTNARLVVFGSIRKIANNYTLELAVTDMETGERKASYLPRQVSLLALENLSAIREASADLLGQLGVNLTANALQELRSAENTARVQAENALAKGIAAQRQGTVVEALTYYFQAAAFDPSLRESVNRVSVVSANISGGNIGQAVRTRLQEHDDWQTVVNAARSFYSNHLPYEFVYDTYLQQGRIDFERRTSELSIWISLIPTDAWKTINDLRQGLRNARQNDEWRFSLDRIEPRKITVTVQILNENNNVLSTASHTFNNPGETNRMNETLTFRNVKADDITDRLTVRVVNINEIPAQRAGESGFIHVMSSSDYDARMAPIWAAETAARREREEQAAKYAAEEATARKRREIFSHTSLLPPVLFEFGYVFEPDYPIGFRIGTFGFYMTMNFYIPNWQGYEHWDFSPFSDEIDLGNREKSRWEMVGGFSFNVFDNLLMIPIGIGFRYTNKYGLFEETYTYTDNETEWYSIDKEFRLLLETGVSFNPVRWISLFGTLRVIGFKEVSFTVGTCLTVPRWDSRRFSLWR